MPRIVSPDRQQEFDRIHAYVAFEIIGWMSSQSLTEISNTELLQMLNERATPEALGSAEWPREPEHMAACIENSKEALAHFGISLRRKQAGRKPSGVQRYLWEFSKTEAAK